MNTETMNSFISDYPSGQEHLSVDHYPARTRFILKMLAGLQHGALHLELPDGQSARFGDESRPVTLRLNDLSMFNAVLRSGDIGFAETYIDGSWSTDDLTGLIALFIRNRQTIESLFHGKWWGQLLYRMRHLFNRNSRSGSRKNIHAHYDIGNDFYRLWLDPSMTYSSALFSKGHDSNLQQGQEAKYHRILGQLAVKPGEQILEIGCGWGGFAEIAARVGGARVRGLTLSSEQLQYAQQRLAEAGLADRTEMMLMDYRDSKGRYDAIASIEMFEAVGEEFWPSYFECIARNLKDGGRACIQTIVIADELFENYRKGTDFIQQYIFPGGMLPSPSAFRAEAEKHGLCIVDEFSFGPDYARTLAEWRDAFKQRLPQVRKLGFDERFLRTWEFYFGYCEAGFRADSIGVMQFTLKKIW
jgi:cyclopropane-fatty-acyl-phospholipid synthase